jgi:hypothetical protein
MAGLPGAIAVPWLVSTEMAIHAAAIITRPFVVRNRVARTLAARNIEGITLPADYFPGWPHPLSVSQNIIQR